jgi:hypothetical protein
MAMDYKQRNIWPAKQIPELSQGRPHTVVLADDTKILHFSQ